MSLSYFLLLSLAHDRPVMNVDNLHHQVHERQTNNSLQPFGPFLTASGRRCPTTMAVDGPRSDYNRVHKMGVKANWEPRTFHDCLMQTSS